MQDLLAALSAKFNFLANLANLAGFNLGKEKEEREGRERILSTIAVAIIIAVLRLLINH